MLLVIIKKTYVRKIGNSRSKISKHQFFQTKKKEKNE